jgi:hypothetical protein
MSKETPNATLIRRTEKQTPVATATTAAIQKGGRDDFERADWP